MYVLKSQKKWNLNKNNIGNKLYKKEKRKIFKNFKHNKKTSLSFYILKKI